MKSLKLLYDQPLDNPEMCAFHDFQVSKIYRQEAERLIPLSWFYRSASRHRVDSAIVYSQITPGPHGVRAIEQLDDGDFWEGIKNLTIEVERLTRWIEASGPSEANDKLDLFNYLYRGGVTLSQLGRFQEARDWLNRALDAFKNLSEFGQTTLSEAKENTILRIVLCLELERRYKEALQTINTFLGEFAFSSFPTIARENLRSLKFVLEEFAPLAAEFSDGQGTLDILGRYMERIESCDSFEAVRRLRREMILSFRKEGCDCRIREMAAAAISYIKRQEAISDEQFAKVSKPNVKLKLMSDDQIAQIIDPDIRELAMASNKRTEEFQRMFEGLEESAIKFRALSRSLSQDVNKISISQIEETQQKAYRVPIGVQVRWMSLELWRVLIQLIVLSYIVEKIIEDLLRHGGEHLLKVVKLEDHKTMFEAVLLIVIFLIGKLIEKRIDTKEMKRYKAALVDLVMERSQTIWTSFNCLVQMERNARQGLDRLQLLINEWDSEQVQQKKDDAETNLWIKQLGNNATGTAVAPAMGKFNATE